MLDGKTVYNTKKMNWRRYKLSQNHELTLLYKMSNDLTPHYLSSLFPQPVGAFSSYNIGDSGSKNEFCIITPSCQLQYVGGAACLRK